MSTAAKRVALDLQAALAARALADYHLGEDVQHSDVIQQCERVKKIVTFAAQVGIQMQRQKVG
ncbi:hypothetical protein [Arenimonas malthae]|uniref:hypothetical protein n=1 Tax=Arenimonas malthae TaxID=354197 RepID=UPI0012EC9AAD|nr:hypothetical protein [Arenimonas malthae]